MGDWRGEILSHLRNVILEADPEVTEEWKWNTGVWTRYGLVLNLSVDKLTDALDVNLLLALSGLGNIVRSLHAHQRVHLHTKRLFDAESHISRKIGLRIQQAGNTIRGLIEDRTGPAAESAPITFLQGSYKQQAAICTINDVDIVALCNLTYPGTPGGFGKSYGRDETFRIIAAPLFADGRYRDKVRFGPQSMTCGL